MGAESPKPANRPTGAVFLSYASQDAEAAKRICDALRAGGIEVWFDQSELRGGDAWDQKIRRELHDCTLFIPVISANTAARHEGYFRLEWDLADQRTHMIARNRAFIVPVCVDATPETSADTPESFQRVHWTRLPRGETPPRFVERVERLLSGEAASPADHIRTPGSAVATGTSARRELISRPMGLYGAIAAAALLALGYFGLERYDGLKPRVPGAASIAVLPLADESGDASQQYFSDGISEDLITALSQFAGLKVIGRSSAFQFRNSKEDSRSIGTKLGVAHLLEGSVRKSGDTIRVTAELIDTADGSTQWSERYDRPYKDLFALQDEITHAVAGALRAKLLLGEHSAAQSERPPSGSLEAYNALLQGRFFDFRYTEADARKAIESYTQATNLDPLYALAWSELAGVWAGLGVEYLKGAPQQEAYAKARTASDRALAISPELPAAHLARGFLLQVAFDWRGAEAEYRRALALAPSDPEAKYFAGRQLACIGELEPAIELTRQALATEPLRANWYKWLAIYLAGLNRLDEAERAIHRAIELQPGASEYHQRLAIIEIQRGHAQAALAAAQQEPAGYLRYSALALAQQIGNEPSAADPALRMLIENEAGGAAYQIAEVYALRNDPEATFNWLDQSWRNRDPGIAFLLFDPFILRYKNDPRFAVFCRKVGLPVPGEERQRA
jgi:TolB-like protein/Tfp pilus assembly protein PilF